MIKLHWGRVLVELERSLDIPEVVVFKLQKAWNHFCKVGGVCSWTSFVSSSYISFFLNNSCGVVEWSTCHKAPLCRTATCSLDVEEETVCWEFLATPYLYDMAWFYFTPGDWLESLQLDCNIEELKKLVIDFICDSSLSHLKWNVPYSH